jgi:hypothetical protein
MFRPTRPVSNGLIWITTALGNRAASPGRFRRSVLREPLRA